MEALCAPDISVKTAPRAYSGLLYPVQFLLAEGGNDGVSCERRLWTGLLAPRTSGDSKNESLALIGFMQMHTTEAEGGGSDSGLVQYEAVLKLKRKGRASLDLAMSHSNAPMNLTAMRFPARIPIGSIPTMFNRKPALSEENSKHPSTPHAKAVEDWPRFNSGFDDRLASSGTPHGESTTSRTSSLQTSLHELAAVDRQGLTVPVKKRRAPFAMVLLPCSSEQQQPAPGASVETETACLFLVYAIDWSAALHLATNGLKRRTGLFDASPLGAHFNSDRIPPDGNTTPAATWHYVGCIKPMDIDRPAQVGPSSMPVLNTPTRSWGQQYGEKEKRRDDGDTNPSRTAAIQSSSTLAENDAFWSHAPVDVSVENMTLLNKAVRAGVLGARLCALQLCQRINRMQAYGKASYVPVETHGCSRYAAIDITPLSPILLSACLLSDNEWTKSLNCTQ
jgi:hypothetical protein